MKLLLPFFIVIIANLWLSDVILGQEIVLHGKTIEISHLNEENFDRLLPAKYRIEYLSRYPDLEIARQIHNCIDWNKETKHLEKLPTKDKFIAIDLANMKNICWLVDRLRKSKATSNTIGTIDDIASADRFPAGLAYNGFLGQTEYVKDSALVPSPTLDVHIELGALLKIDQVKLRNYIWSSFHPTISDLTEELFQPSMSMITAKATVSKTSEYAVEGNFLRTMFRMTLIARGFDADHDSIEDWAVINEINDQTGNWTACYPALISKIRIKNRDVFYIKDSAPAGRCG